MSGSESEQYDEFHTQLTKLSKKRAGFGRPTYDPEYSEEKIQQEEGTTVAAS